MTDYAKKKNDELAALCKERGLAHTGKKAELVKRLEDHDSSNKDGASGAEQPASESVDTEDKKEDTVDTNGKYLIDDAIEPEPQVEQSAGSATAAAVTAPDTNTSTTTAEETQTETKAATEEPSAKDFSLGLEERTLDDEIEKRKKRAAKFGLDTSKDETLKQLERAKRFGGSAMPGLLNQALPERAERNKKRGREAKEDKEDKEDKDGRKRSRQRPTEESKPQAKSDDGGKYPTWMTTKDREAAERRKAKFSTAT